MPRPDSTAETPEPDDALLLQRFAREGDVAAMDALVLRHAESLQAFLRGWVADDASREDFFQETWTRVIRAPERFQGGNFRAWLLCIARNLVIDRHRRLSPDLLLDEPVSDSESALTRVDLLRDEDATLPDAALARKDLGETILKAVHELPPPQREVFLLRIEEVPFADIAERLRIPLNTALGRMHYAIERLRKSLSAELPPRRLP